MNKAFFLIPALILTLLSCKNDPKTTSTNGAPDHIQPGEQANPTVLAGHWIALDFCAFASQYGSVLQAMNNSHIPYAYAFTFNPAYPDSIICYNAFESWSRPIKMRADTIEVLEARPGKSLFLIYHSTEEKDITMVDPTGPRTRLSRFIKSKAGTPDGRTAFMMALNHHVFSGLFTPIGKSSDEKISFFPHGVIQGMKAYDRYEICSGGDCFVAGQDIDVVTLYNNKDKQGSSKFFGYRYSAQNDTLTFYNLVNSNPDEKGTYKVAAPAFKYLRKKVE
jgi:hypothetical protein